MTRGPFHSSISGLGSPTGGINRCKVSGQSHRKHRALLCDIYVEDPKHTDFLMQV